MIPNNKTKKFIHAQPLINFYRDKANGKKFPWTEMRSNSLCFTSNLVLDDFFTNLGRQVCYSYAADVAQSILQSDSIEILRASLDNERQALKYFNKYGDKQVSFADSVSHVLRLAYQIETHFPFEQDVRIPRYPSGQTSAQEELQMKPGCPILHSFWSKSTTGRRPSCGRPKLFVDTAAFLAKFSNRDREHERAEKLWNKIAVSNYECYTSNFVLEEFFTLLAARVNYKYAHDVATHFLESHPFIILRADKQIELSAANEFAKHAPLEISFADCVSFTLMRAHGITEAFTFDNDFKKPGNFSLFDYNKSDSAPKKK